MDELEKNAVKGLLSLRREFIRQSSCSAPVTETKEPERLPISFILPRRLLPQHPQQQQQLVLPARSEEIVTTKPGVRVARSIQCIQSSPRNGSNDNHQVTIRLSTTTGCSTVVPRTSSNFTWPVRLRPVSAESPGISTILNQTPGLSAGVSGATTNGSTTGTAVMSPSFTIILAPHESRIVTPTHTYIVGGNSAPGVKLVMSTPVTTAGTLNPSNIQLVKAPRSSIDSSIGVTTFNPLTRALPPVPMPTQDLTPRPIATSSVSATDAKPPKSTSKILAEGLVNKPKIVVVEGYEISREIWAKAFLEKDIIHAGTLFSVLFSSDEIKNCRLSGGPGKRQLCLAKRRAIFKIVAWMRNKCQDPYSFHKSPEDSKILSREEQLILQKAVFVQRRYQMSRYIKDLPPPLPTLSMTPVSNGSSATLSLPSSATTPKTNAPERQDSVRFSTDCSTRDCKGIPKIALIQPSEIIANSSRSTAPRLIPASSTSPIHNHHDEPSPMKMQKLG